MFVLRFLSCGCRIFLQFNKGSQSKFIPKTLHTRHHFLSLSDFMNISVLKIFEVLKATPQILHESKTYLVTESTDWEMQQILKNRYSYYFVYLEMVLWTFLLLSKFLAYVWQSTEKVSHDRNRPVVTLMPCKSSVWGHSP